MNSDEQIEAALKDGFSEDRFGIDSCDGLTLDEASGSA